MFFDEDGDLAHEFYQEEMVVNSAGVVRWAMKRVFRNLRPQVLHFAYNGMRDECASVVDSLRSDSGAWSRLSLTLTLAHSLLLPLSADGWPLCVYGWDVVLCTAGICL